MSAEAGNKGLDVPAGRIDEKLLQFIWKFQYYDAKELFTVQGEKLEVQTAGTLNLHQGPDFLNAKLRIGTTIFAGSVELHCKTSQWDEHGHSRDPNYSNVILHVVFEHDREAGPEGLPVLELQPRIPHRLIERYRTLMQEPNIIPCAGSLHVVDEIVWTKWKERLIAERLMRKSGEIYNVLESTRFHWDEVFWRLLAKNFGLRVNTEAFEQLARSLPLSLLSRHRKQIHHLEALLLGQANLLSNRFSDHYPKLLAREYYFLKKKYSLAPISIPVHFLRMRPGNFPSVRLAQLAMLLHEKNIIFSEITGAQTLKELRSFLHVTPNDYWLYHYVPDEPSPYRKKDLGKDTIDNIIINTIIPFLFTYGLYHKKENIKARAVQFLHELGPENNSVVKLFSRLGVCNKNGFHSQALLELKWNYCDHKRCLDCMAGYQMLRKGVT